MPLHSLLIYICKSFLNTEMKALSHPTPCCSQTYPKPRLNRMFLTLVAQQFFPLSSMLNSIVYACFGRRAGSNLRILSQYWIHLTALLNIQRVAGPFLRKQTCGYFELGHSNNACKQKLWTLSTLLRRCSPQISAEYRMTGCTWVSNI